KPSARKSAERNRLIQDSTANGATKAARKNAASGMAGSVPPKPSSLWRSAIAETFASRRSDLHLLGEARDPLAAQLLELGPVEQLVPGDQIVEPFGQLEVRAGELDLLVGRHHDPGRGLQALLHRLAHDRLEVGGRELAGLGILDELRAGAHDDGAGVRHREI